MNTAGIDRARLRETMDKEIARFISEHAASGQLFERAKSSLLAGVPMNWMVRWAGPYPVFARKAKGSVIWDVDGNEYLDLCLGDTGAMFGHSPDAVVNRLRDRLGKGITTMLPTEDSVWVSEELARRFGLPYWQIALTATDANRFSIRLAREVTGRSRVLVVHGCYHGTVDETLVDLKAAEVVPRGGNIGPPVDPRLTTRVVEFNDLPALENALEDREVACVLCEPAMTNRGIILPDHGYHDSLREMTQKTGTILIMDETHTICCGPGGYTRAHGLTPDMLTIGKPIGSGIPAAAFGMSQQVADAVMGRILADGTDESGLGGTLSGNALAVSAMRATLETMITENAFERMLVNAKRLEEGVAETIAEFDLPWHVTRLGVRVEYHFRQEPPRNGTEAEEAKDSELERLLHLMMLNRGILITPFHNMALISPFTTEDEVDLHTETLRECLQILRSRID